MPCLVGCLALFFPRLALILVFLAGDSLGRAYQTNLWPVLGFIFAPTTTLAYAWAINERGSVSGWYLLAMIIAMLIDLGLLGGGASGGRKHYRKVKRV